MLVVHLDRRPGGHGKVVCSGGFLVARPDQPCPICEPTSDKVNAAPRVYDAPMRDVIRLGPRPMAAIPAPLNGGEWRTIKVPEGVSIRLNRDGEPVRRGGKIQMDTIDFRSDAAVRNRVARTMSRRNGHGRVTGGTSVSRTWGIPARPGVDTLANAGDVLKDMRAIDVQERKRAGRPVPRKGKRVPRRENVVRRYVK